MVDGLKGVELVVHGIVQGVGFRPFVHKLAIKMGLTGTVTNSGEGVVIRLTCPSDKLDSFLLALNHQAPPLARITAIHRQTLFDHPQYHDFTIDISESGAVRGAMIPPDIALCDDCLHELTDPTNRRYHYPFINCTNCGPRFTIVETIPYDRPQTSMKQFTMCENCSREYGDPVDRRFHAQPNACFDCGPSLSYHDGHVKETDDPINATIQALNRGKVVAIRGLGGFHLTVDGTSAQAVGELRARKGRPEKPLAIMVGDLDMLHRLCDVSPLAEELLCSPQHPIVLLTKIDSTIAADNLAPGIDEIGVMLPYTPFHHMLLGHTACPQVLVMTSGNISGEPICTSNKDALDKLDRIADCFLLHNRDIVTRVDDSVAGIMNGKVMLFRRARGYVPAPIQLATSLPRVLACGGGLKSTFCLTRDHFAFLSQHIGDLFNLESLEFYSQSVEHLQKVLEIEPELTVCDLHPDYLSTRFAEELGLPLYRVQHHHAHAVSVMAEHGLTDKVLAVVLDGTGYGIDGTIWGGEILACDYTDFQRLAHLTTMPLPGGDAAASEPYRMALSALYTVNGPDGLDPENLPTTLAAIDPRQIQTITQMLTKNLNCPLTSSCGRLFDAVAALLGIRQVTSFEGQAAMELESLAWAGLAGSGKNQISDLYTCKNIRPLVEESGVENEPFELETHSCIRSVIEGTRQGQPVETIALQFHLQLIDGITKRVRGLSITTGLSNIVLSGGCMQNRLLLEGLTHTLGREGLKIYTGSEVPVNDGGISLGQAIIGGLLHVSSDTHASHPRHR